MYRHILLAFSVFVAVQAFSKGKCPWAIGKFPFDESKFSGDWHMIEGLPLKGKTYRSDCAKYNVGFKKIESDMNIDIRYTGNKDGKAVVYESKALAFKPEVASMSIGVWKPTGSPAWSGVYKQSVVATDYENYAVFYACKSDFDPETFTFSRNVLAEIWGRQNTLSEEQLQILRNILSNYDVDVAKLIKPDHSNC